MNANNENKQPRVALVDDEEIPLREIRRHLEKESYAIETFIDGESVLKRMKETSFDLVLCDLRLPGINGIDVLKAIKSTCPHTEVIVITGYASVDTAIEAIQSGAFHFVTKPVKMGELKSLVSRALEKTALIKEKNALKKALFTQSRQQYLIGHSPAIQEVIALIKKVCSVNCNLLVLGESGTGKELVARAVHFLGSRRESPFIAFNCGGFTEDLISNELFGHEKGAFTGAVDTRIGLLETADKGTVFLDEINTMPAVMQIKLLRFLQERTLIRLGGTRQIPVDVRIIAAGNQDLEQEVAKQHFREDLYYRLKVVSIYLPPLRDRVEDIPLLVQHFLNKYNEQFNKNLNGIENEVIDILKSYPFPGNVRELENIIERAVALSADPWITTDDLPRDLLDYTIDRLEQDRWPSLKDYENDYIRRVLKKTGFHRDNAAKILGIPRTTLWRRLKEMKLTP